jgi:hypothetical protein
MWTMAGINAMSPSEISSPSSHGPPLFSISESMHSYVRRSPLRRGIHLLLWETPAAHRQHKLLAERFRLRKCEELLFGHGGKARQKGQVERRHARAATGISSMKRMSARILARMTVPIVNRPVDSMRVLNYQADDNDLLDTVLLEPLVEVGVGEAALCPVLLDDGLSRLFQNRGDLGDNGWFSRSSKKARFSLSFLCSLQHASEGGSGLPIRPVLD